MVDIQLDRAADPTEHIAENYALFQSLVDDAHAALDGGRIAEAAARAHLAALHACWHHPGLFASGRLEHLLHDIAEREGIGAHETGAHEEGGEVRSVLHVLTQAAGIGGHTRMLWRWILEDRTRSHSVAITRQGSAKPPRALRDAVRASGGRIHLLNESRGDLVSWARRLRSLANSHDAVVLHANGDDVVPAMALSGESRPPPVIFIDHADHIFWLGTSTSDLVVHLRDYSRTVAVERRQVEEERSVVFPIPMEPFVRQRSQEDARQLLDLPRDAVVLLSIARGHKYEPFGDQTFMDGLAPVLAAFDQAQLVIVGTSGGPMWEKWRRAFPGRIRLMGASPHTRMFYEAADIYVDSFPVSSTTSLLEAGSASLPLVSRCAMPRCCGVSCADTPGLSPVVAHASELTEFVASVSALVQDPAERLRSGEETRRTIESFHVGTAWRDRLELLYAQALKLPRGGSPMAPVDVPGADRRDAGVVAGFSPRCPEDFERIALRQFYRELPMTQRYRRLTASARDGAAVDPALLFPEWARQRLARWR